MYLAIVLGPLAAALLAGLGGRLIGRRGRAFASRSSRWAPRS